jgi:WD40 repeat protein
MDTVVGREPLIVSIWWRLGLAFLLGALVGAIGGMAASALSQGVLLIALLARPVFQFSSLRAWWRAIPSSDRSTIGFRLITECAFYLIMLPILLWQITGLTGLFLGLGGPALALGLAASILFGINERSRRATCTSISCGAAAGMGALLGVWTVMPPGILTLQVMMVTFLLAAGGGIVGMLIWWFVRLVVQLKGKSEASQPANQPEPIAVEDASPAEKQLSRRAVLEGAAKGAALLAVGGGMIWATRSFVPQLVPLYVYRGHRGYVLAVAWSPDGHLIASAGYDKTVQVWKPFQLAAPILIYRGHMDVVVSLAWSPDSKRLASSSIDETTRIWDARTGAHLLTYPKGGSVAWSPNGTSLALVTADDIEVWSASTGQKRLSYTGPGNGGPRAVAWSPDSTRLASSADDLTVQVWDSITGATYFTTPVRQIVYGVAWSPDGKRLVSANDGTFLSIGSDNQVTEEGKGPSAQVFDAVTGREVLQYNGHRSIVNTAAWSPDGKRVATGGGDIEQVDNSVQVWSASDGSLTARYGGHRDQTDAAIFSLTWSPNGRWIASASADQTVQIWQPE